MCKTAQLYAMAQTSVFCRYPAWKLNAVREDRAEHRDSSILDSFAKDVENEVNLLEVIIPLVGQFCEWVCLRENRMKIHVFSFDPGERFEAKSDSRGERLGQSGWPDLQRVERYSMSPAMLCRT